MDDALLIGAIIALWKLVEFLISWIKEMAKKNGSSESAKAEPVKAIELETKEILLNFWQDTKTRTDEIKSMLGHIKERVDFLDHVASELDEKKLRVIWRDTEREKKDHRSLSRILEIQEEMNKSMAVIEERTRRGG